MAFKPRVAFLVPVADYEEDWGPAFTRKLDALVAVGLAVEPKVWNNAGELAGFDLILPLFAWGYQRQVDNWYRLLDQLEREQLRVVNPVAVLRWNSDKAYLHDLAAKGVPIVPTIDCAALDDAAIVAARASFGADILVIKPAISGGADGTFRLGPDDSIAADARGQRRLIQPMMPGIADEGEYSLFYFDGHFSHAIVKRPAVGDFRVQVQFGGREFPCAPFPEAAALAEMALAACPAPPTYARVDMVGDGAGQLVIMELELIEPSLFLQFAPDKGTAFANAIKRAATTATDG